jgi:hypothetical protein
VGIKFEKRIQVVIGITWEERRYVPQGGEEWTKAAAEDEISLPLYVSTFYCIFMLSKKEDWPA